MLSPLVECIPNFSDARRPEVIDAVENSIKSIPGIRVLDRHSDVDHNRSVITFIGPPKAIEEAAFQAIAKAASLIDLNSHSGEHPRIGAADVVPFVPIQDVTMKECVEMASRLGQRVGSELQIPVYLYEEAATRPDRQRLENIRKGQYEGLKLEIGTDPERVPDFGPSQLGPAGATVIGARYPLIAFNVYLTTSDVEIAQKIARAVRHSSGGLHYVKAMGVLVDGRAQVSMNLTNYKQTPIARVVEMIRRETQRYGVAIHHSELVGLIPQEALINASKWYLQLDDLENNQVLEHRLYQEVASSSATQMVVPPGSFLDQLASEKPVPAGGSATAYTGAAAAALIVKTAQITMGKKQYADVEEQMQNICIQAEYLQSELTHAIEQDASAYATYLAAARLPNETPQQQIVRSAALNEATRQTVVIPLEIANRVLSLMTLIHHLARYGYKNILADVASALILARAAIQGASINVQANTKYLKNDQTIQSLLEKMTTIEKSALLEEQEIKSVLKERGDLKLPE